MTVERCANCAFHVKKWDHAGGRLTCHRRAPIGVAAEGGDLFFGVRALWPVVNEDDFCGEWELIG